MKKTLFGNRGKQVDYRHDQKGREISSELKWLTKDMPGVQKTHNKTRYYFNDQSKVLTTEYENSHGHVTKELKDTRNDRLIAQISALGEKVQYGYNELGQIIQLPTLKEISIAQPIRPTSGTA